MAGPEAEPDMSATLIIRELYLSLQGESSWAGWPCVFVRTTGCPLRCSYCDTAYAFAGGTRMTVAEVRRRVHELAGSFGRAVAAPRLPLVELTGGEPLVQPAAVPLMEALCQEGFTVLLETSGTLDISPVDRRVHRILDLKCPSSGETERNLWDNLRHLQTHDEIKFVLASHEDYDWARQQLQTRQLTALCPVLFSWAAPLLPGQQHPSLHRVPLDHHRLTRQELAERILADALPVRFQLQLHKFIWPPDRTGV
jgi:7-carboxy-7-deazaguanine synthase